ncbi:MAG TPA: cupin domain-containing protein [Victivallales bacterium]|nr:cupin domain-containing protein [Victivallales bacterium]
MIYNKAKGQIVFKDENATGVLLNSANRTEYVHLNIKAKSRIASHVLGMPVTFFVLKGKGEILIDDKSVLVQAGDLIEVDKNTSRAWNNYNESELEILVIKHV